MENKRPPRSKLWLALIGLGAGLLLGCLVLGALLLTGVISPAIFVGESFDPANAVTVGDPAPDFELTDLSGQTVRLSDFRGRAVVLNFWATWCGPCIRETFMFDEYNSQYADSLVVLGVDLQESEAEVQAFTEQIELAYPLLLDPRAGVGKTYQVTMLPSTFFIDKDGVVCGVHLGELSEEQFKGYLLQIGVGE